MPSDTEQPHPIFRPGGVSYLRIPTDDPRRSAAFYEAVFGWTLSGDPDRPKTVGPTVPFGRAGFPEEVARTVLWLLSSEASYVVNAIVDVGGGR